MSQEMAAIISDSNNAYHARDKAQSEMMALRQQVCLICSVGYSIESFVFVIYFVYIELTWYQVWYSTLRSYETKCKDRLYINI